MSACVCCDTDIGKIGWRWTDTHGIAVCSTCGMPYRILHYEGEGESSKRVEREPEPALTAEGIAIARAYWTEHKRTVYPGSFCIGFIEDGHTSYSGHTVEEARAFGAWYEARKEKAQEVAP